MIKTIITFTFALISFSINGQIEAISPSLKIDIEINGEKYHVNDGDTLTVNNNKIIARISNSVTFDYGILKFDYPKHFAFSSETDFGYQNWTLDGNNFVVSYFKLSSEVELDMLIKEIVIKFGKKNCTVNKKTSKIGNTSLEGKRINVELLGQKLTYDMYKVKSNDGSSHFISFQDSKNDDGSDSLESIETLSLINSTFFIKQNKKERVR